MSPVKCQVNLQMILHSSDIFIRYVTTLKGIKEERITHRPVKNETKSSLLVPLTVTSRHGTVTPGVMGDNAVKAMQKPSLCPAENLDVLENLESEGRREPCTGHPIPWDTLS